MTSAEREREDLEHFPPVTPLVFLYHNAIAIKKPHRCLGSNEVDKGVVSSKARADVERPSRKAVGDREGASVKTASRWRPFGPPSSYGQFSPSPPPFCVPHPQALLTTVR